MYLNNNNQSNQNNPKVINNANKPKSVDIFDFIKKQPNIIINKRVNNTNQYDVAQDHCYTLLTNNMNTDNNKQGNSQKINKPDENNKVHYQYPLGGQKNLKARYCIDDLTDDPVTISCFTGLENYYKFMTVFFSLGQNLETVKLPEGCTANITLRDQLFLTLWKLKHNCPDVELSRHFGILKPDVSVVFKMWISFMYTEWSKLHTWPNQEILDYFTPEEFKNINTNSETEKIINDTDLQTEQTKSDNIDNTVPNKIVIEVGGLYNECNDEYNDDEFNDYIDFDEYDEFNEYNELDEYDEFSDEFKYNEFEDFSELNDFESEFNDFNEFDETLIPRKKIKTKENIETSNQNTNNVQVLIPSFNIKNNEDLKNQSLSDSVLASYCAHVEKTLEILKTFKILTSKLNKNNVDISSKIVGVCVMLTTFKDCVKKDDE